jgi:hypothetical protein
MHSSRGGLNWESSRNAARRKRLRSDQIYSASALPFKSLNSRTVRRGWISVANLAAGVQFAMLSGMTMTLVPIRRFVCDFRDSVYFLLSKSQVMSPFFG